VATIIAMSQSAPTTKRPVTAFQLEQAMSLYMQLRQVQDDDFDETEIERKIREAGLHTPREMLSGLIDACVLLDQRADQMEALRKRYADKRDRYRERMARVQATVVQIMQDVLGETAAEGELGSASFVKPSKHVVILELAKLPEKFVTRPDPVPKKNDIREAIKAGEAVPGAEYGVGNEAPTLRVTPY
jgi:hypothetical protein